IAPALLIPLRQGLAPINSRYPRCVHRTQAAVVASLEPHHNVPLESGFAVTALGGNLQRPDFAPDELLTELADVPVLIAHFVNVGRTQHRADACLDRAAGEVRHIDTRVGDFLTTSLHEDVVRSGP